MSETRNASGERLWPADPYDPQYVDALDADVRAVCSELVAGVGSGLKLTHSRCFSDLGVLVRVRRDDDDPNRFHCSMWVPSASVRGERSPARPWVLAETADISDEDPCAAAELHGAEAGMAQQLVRMVAGALAWPAAAVPPRVRIRLLFDKRRTAAQRRRDEGRSQEQIARDFGYAGAVLEEACRQWEEGRQAFRAEGAEDAGFASMVQRRVDDAAWNFLRPSLVEALEGRLDEWGGDGPSLLRTARAIRSWSPDQDDDNCGFVCSGPEDGADLDVLRIVDWCKKFFARSWLAGNRGLGELLLEEVLRIESERSAGTVAESLLALALLDRNIPAVLNAGRAVICGTGYASLATYIGKDIARARKVGDHEFADELARRAERLTPRPWAFNTWERDPAAGHSSGQPRPPVPEVDDESRLLLTSLDPVAEASCRRLHLDLLALLAQDSEQFLILADGAASGWLSVSVGRSGVVLDAAHPRTGDVVATMDRLRGFGLVVDAEDDFTHIEVRASRDDGDGGSALESAVCDVVRMAVVLSHHVYGEDVTRLSWH